MDDKTILSSVYIEREVITRQLDYEQEYYDNLLEILGYKVDKDINEVFDWI